MGKSVITFVHPWSIVENYYVTEEKKKNREHWWRQHETIKSIKWKQEGGLR